MSSEELLRARRFRKQEDRARYVVAHAGLRWILARVYGIDFPLQHFVRGAQGKPRLASPARPAIQFNLSHSGSLVLIAASTDAEVGVDIEWKDAAVDLGVLETFCTAGERTWLAALPDSVRIDAIFRLWTIKEALTKAHGAGLGSELRAISVDLSVARSTRLLRVGDGPEGWFVQELSVGSEYAAAVAYSGGPMILRQFSAAFRHGELAVDEVEQASCLFPPPV